MHCSLLSAEEMTSNDTGTLEKLAAMASAPDTRNIQVTKPSRTCNEVSGTETQPASDQQPRVYLFETAQELQDIIFDFAYPGHKTELLTKEEWNQLFTESLTNGRDGVLEYFDEPWTKPFPGSKVGEFLVSKTFYPSAVKAWVKNQCFSPRLHGSGREVQVTWGSFLNTSGILFHNLECLLLPGRVVSAQLQDAFPQLKKVTMQVVPRFDSKLRKAVLSDEELKKTPEYGKAVCFRGLIDLELDFGTATKLQVPVLEKNFKRFRELARPIVTLPRPASKLPPPRPEDLPPVELPWLRSNEVVSVRPPTVSTSIRQSSGSTIEWKGIEVFAALSVLAIIVLILGLSAVAMWLFGLKIVSIILVVAVLAFPQPRPGW